MTRFNMKKVAALREAYAWTELDESADMLAFTVGKTVAETVYAKDDVWNDKEWNVLLFADGTGFALEMDGGWSGTEVTGGEPASVTYYALRRRDGGT